ncbi:MAG: HAD-IIB family hydrolase [Helicobacteraceae bacterium]|nr:HAD-IIB family hydrolase [Helicobacteraceae bacterium]
MKKIYITDLDHTFLRNDLSISDYTKTIWNAKAQDSILGVATARSLKRTKQYLQGVHINAPMILLDGALVATHEHELIDSKLLSAEIGDSIIAEGAKFGIYPFVLSLLDAKLNEGFLHSNILNEDQIKVLANYDTSDGLLGYDNLRATEQNLKIVYMGEEQLLRDLEKHLKAIYGDELKYILAPEAYVGCYFLTLLHKDADKAHGIQSVSEYMGFDLAELTVFGDNYNDLGMFELANISVAVANAQEGVKAKAKIILEHSNEQDAVAKYLKSLLHV